MPAGGNITKTDGYAIDVDADVPDMHNYSVLLLQQRTEQIYWTSNFSLLERTLQYLPLALIQFLIPEEIITGNWIREKLLMLSIEINNEGSSGAVSVFGELTSSDPNVVINSSTQAYGNIASGGTVTKTFSVSADENTPSGHSAEFSS